MRLTLYPWAILAVLFVAAPCVAAPPTTTPNSAASFDQHKADGDRARLAQLWEQALAAYDKALAIRKDAVVSGRAGLILAKLERFDVATRLLQRAVNDTSADIDPWERQVFFDEFLRSADQVCRVDVHVDQTNARVEIDGTESVDDRADFFVYLNPGVHTIFAQKPGFHDAVRTLMTDRACKRKIALIMQPVPIEQLSLDKYLKVVPQNLLPDDRVRESSGSKRTLYVAKPPPNPYEPSRNRWFVGGVGVWIPFGVTSGMGFGAQVHAGARVTSNFEISLETKVATHVLTMDVDSRLHAGSAYAWSVGAAPCGRIFDRAFFCAVPQLNGGNRLTGVSSPWWKVSIGGRLGLEFHPTNRVHLRFFGELAALSSPLSSRSNDTSFTREGSRAIGGLGATIAFF